MSCKFVFVALCALIVAVAAAPKPGVIHMVRPMQGKSLPVACLGSSEECAETNAKAKRANDQKIIQHLKAVKKWEAYEGPEFVAEWAKKNPKVVAQETAEIKRLRAEYNDAELKKMIAGGARQRRYSSEEGSSSEEY